MDKMKIKALAEVMGVTHADLTGFIECLLIWVSKGYSLQEAIEKHMSQMKRLVNGSTEFMKLPAVRKFAVDAFYDK